MGSQQGPGHVARRQAGREPVVGAHTRRLVSGGFHQGRPHVVPEAHVLRARQRGRNRGYGGPGPAGVCRVCQRQRAQVDPASAPGAPVSSTGVRPVPDGHSNLPATRRHPGGQAAGGPSRGAVRLVPATRCRAAAA